MKGIMMAHSWSTNKATDRINKLLDEVKYVTIVEYSRDMSLANIPKNKAYRSDSVHLYVDILNLDEILATTDSEGETCHKRALKFLNLHYRAVDRILNDTGALRVDFHNQRLHAVISKPYGSEKDRINKAVAIAQLIISVLKETGEVENSIPDAIVRVGIDSGKSLIVNNGRRGGQEPLFLGPPANEAAKLASDHSATGIFLTNNAREVIGLPVAANPKKTPLNKNQIEDCEESANLDISKDKIIDAWKKDLENNPIGSFNFSGHTPPLSTLDISALTPSNSRRQELVSIYADVSGFTAYVRDHIDENTEDVIRVLHVIRSELDNVLSKDFEGRKIRFIGDCIHGVFCLGTAQTTDTVETISESVLCSGALRSSFNKALEIFDGNDVEYGDLGLSIGFEYGQTAITRLGIKGSLVRCAVSRAVLNSEASQSRCNSVQTAIGSIAYKKANDAVKNLFGEGKIISYLDYVEAVDGLAENDDESAKSAKKSAYVNSSPTVAAAAITSVKPFCR
jgi:class 3 adenylate cyclase